MGKESSGSHFTGNGIKTSSSKMAEVTEPLVKSIVRTAATSCKLAE